MIAAAAVLSTTPFPSARPASSVRGTDRVIVRLGAVLVAWGHRRAARAAGLRAARGARSHAWATHVERSRDNAAQTHPLLLR